MFHTFLMMALFSVAVTLVPAPANTQVSVSSSMSLIPQTNWKLLYVDSEQLVADPYGPFPAINAFDSNSATIWHTQHNAVSGGPPPPHEIQIDLGATYVMTGFRYLPRQDGNQNGWIAKYEFYVSTDGKNWGLAVVTGTFAKDMTEKEVMFPSRTGRYIRLRAMTEINGQVMISAAEINVLGAPANSTSSGTVTATWVDMSTGEDGFSIESGLSTTGPFTVVGQVGQHIQVFTEPDHYPGPQVCYRVRAFLGAATSPYSNVACVTVPTAPDEKLTVSCPVATAAVEPLMHARKKRSVARKHRPCPPVIHP